jgi:phospholipase C
MGIGLEAAVVAVGVGHAISAPPGAAAAALHRNGGGSVSDSATPIEHLVVIFQENVSFDHYFATYPFAANTDGTTFKPDSGTPSVNGLGTLVNGEPSGALLTGNPNFLNPVNNAIPHGANPFRLSHDQGPTCDQDHDYTAEQNSFDLGLMDDFPLEVGGAGCSKTTDFTYGHGVGLVMGYFDGNTVTALWNYAQNFAMSDNSFGTEFGPSTPGALNLVSGQTGGITKTKNDLTGDVIGNTVIGDLLNVKGVSWGSFMGGFDLTITNPDGSTNCKRDNPSATAGTQVDYIPHHAWFQYYPSTSNPNHTRPTVSPGEYGTSADTGANHEYDINDFFDALNAGNLPAVSFLKASAFEDGHAGYSDPLNEQVFLVKTINAIEKSHFWKSTAIVIMYDDSDGWYDHQIGPIVNSSATTADTLSGTNQCGNGTPLKAGSGEVIQGRCGYGPRLPLLVISPFAKRNFVDHSLTDQTSVLRFIEDNWGTGQIGGGSFDAFAGPLTNMFDFGGRGAKRRLFLDPNTGAPVKSPH